MASKRPRTMENEHEEEQVVQQQCDPVIESAQSSPPAKLNKSPVVVFAHGAGAPSTSEWMIRWRNLLVKALNAVEVVTFDYPYGKRKAPPKDEKLVGFHSDIVRNVAAKYPEHPLILVGKSMGSRISCLVAAENDIEASAVVCLGYPLKATKGAIRDEPLLQLMVPIMFVQGSNDVFCPLEVLEAVRKQLKAFNALHVIENGDHSFQIAKRNLELTGTTREEAEAHAVEAVASFVSGISGEKVIAGPRERSQLQEEVGSQVEVVLESQMEPQPKFNPTRRPIAVVESRPKFIHKKRRPSERIILNKLRKNTVEIGGEGSNCEMAIQLD
ncbi:hypothetical protein OSB04_022368 [Centaurea solstitialis]|uniref:KANL3/Tex30 alpha/beta hydrolase-like domain-containing protein n=1 Tax=Centaurea solstitialis TaxID=347529 RepID=A0AA38SW10_9ASTR|nr:hypothetical protein OSB04_022368 [Centaurea solstitialis]